MRIHEYPDCPLLQVLPTEIVYYIHDLRRGYFWNKKISPLEDNTEMLIAHPDHLTKETTVYGDRVFYAMDHGPYDFTFMFNRENELLMFYYVDGYKIIHLESFNENYNIFSMLYRMTDDDIDEFALFDQYLNLL